MEHAWGVVAVLVLCAATVMAATMMEEGREQAALEPTSIPTKECPHNCWDNGDCLRGRCKCKKGFFTQDCSLASDPRVMGWYPLEKVEPGLTVADLSGFQHVGRSSSLDDHTGPQSVPGRFGNALQIKEGASVRIEVPRLEGGTHDFTTAFNVKFMTVNSPQNFLSLWDGGGNKYVWHLMQRQVPTTFEMRVLSNVADIGSGVEVAPHQWYHVAMVTNGQTVRIYVNKRLVAENHQPTLSFKDSIPQIIYLGTDPEDVRDALFEADCVLDDVAVFRAVLSSEEISVLADKGIDGYIRTYYVEKEPCHEKGEEADPYKAPHDDGQQVLLAEESFLMETENTTTTRTNTTTVVPSPTSQPSAPSVPPSPPPSSSPPPPSPSPKPSASPSPSQAPLPKAVNVEFHVRGDLTDMGEFLTVLAGMLFTQPASITPLHDVPEPHLDDVVITAEIRGRTAPETNKIIQRLKDMILQKDTRLQGLGVLETRIASETGELVVVGEPYHTEETPAPTETPEEGQQQPEEEEEEGELSESSDVSPGNDDLPIDLPPSPAAKPPQCHGEGCDPHIVGAWPLDDSEGLSVADISPHGLVGHIRGEPQHVVGRFGLALRLHRSAVEIPLGIGAVTCHFTLSFWAKFDELDGAQHILTIRSPMHRLLAHVVRQVAPVRHVMHFQCATVDVPTLTPIAFGAWTHYVFEFNHGQAAVFINGQLVEEASVPLFEFDEMQPVVLWLGTEPADIVNERVNSKGEIDDVALYHGSLNREHIEHLYLHGMLPETL